MARNQSRRGFAAMEPEQRRRIARRGGQASHGGRRSDYDYFDEDERDWEEEGLQTRGYRDTDYDEYEDEDEGYYADYDEDEDEGYSQSRRGGRGSGRRGFAGMDPERQRRIASMGGRAGHGGRSRDEYEDLDYERGNGGGSSRRSARGGRGTSRRGFAAMDPEKQRRIASMGGRASHGGGRRSANR